MKCKEIIKPRSVIQLVVRLLLVVASLVLIYLYIYPLKMRILTLGNAFGLGVAVLLILAAIFFNPFSDLIKKMWQSKGTKGLLIAILSLLLTFCICFLGTLSSVISNAKYSADNETTVVVLGCRIWGSTPSRALKARAKAASDYLKKNPKAVAIASGGQGSDENISEGQCIYDLMIADGIEPSRIYIEDKSTTTDENIKFSKKIMEENDLSKNIAVATSDYHQKRAKMICRKNGLEAKSLPAKSGSRTAPTYYTREVFGVWVQYLKIAFNK